MFGDLKLGPRWNYEVSHALGTNSTFEASNSKHPQKNLAPWAKSTKFRYLVIWNWALVELRGPPDVGVPIPPSKPQIQNTHEFFWLFEPNRLNLDVWWFEIGAPVELWGPPRIGGPIPPSQPQIQNTYQKNLLFETKY
jgi:hypothetical protein